MNSYYSDYRLLLFFCVFLPACSTDNSRTGIQTLNGEWEYHTGPADEDGGVPADGWRSFSFPGQPPVSTTLFWERVRLPSGSARMHLHFLTVDQFVRVYLGDREIYAFGDPLRPEDHITAGNTMHLVQLPADADEQALLAFLLYSESANPGLNGEVRVGPVDQILMALVRQEIPAFLVSVIFILLGVFLLGAVIWRKSDIGPYSFGIFMFVMGLWVLTQLEMKAIFLSRPYVWRALDLLSLFSIPVAIVLFFEKAFGPGPGRIVRRIWQFHLVYGLAAFLGIFLRMVTPEKTFVPFQVASIVMLVLITVLCFSIARRGDQEARIFFASLALLCVTGMHDMLVALGVSSWSKPISFIGAGSVILGALLIISRRWLREYQFTERSADTDRAGFRPLFVVLQTKFGLSYQEARICCELHEGSSREQIREVLGVKESTLKSQLNSIYKKTIEKVEPRGESRRDKLQRLTVFLRQNSSDS